MLVYIRLKIGFQLKGWGRPALLISVRHFGMIKIAAI